MSIHYKTGGVWETVVRPYVKVGGLWKPVNETWMKDGGAWTRIYEYDVTPPDPPIISVDLIDTTYWETENGAAVKKSGRHLKVGVRTAGINHAGDLKLIRVLGRQPDGSAPTTQFGKTFYFTRDNDFPEEPWSDFSFNGHNRSPLTKQSQNWHYKQWPINAGPAAQVGAGTYYFTAWALDDNNNWSTAVAVEIVVKKKGADAADVIPKSARIQTNNSGTHSVNGFTTGELTQSARDTKRGMWFYGLKITNAIGQQGKPVIKSAQIFVKRKNDSGSPQANIYLWWHDYPDVASLPVDPADLERRNVTLIGTLGKGEGKWFKIPDLHIVQMEADNVKGFGLNQKHQNSATAMPEDFSVVVGDSENIRSGEVSLVWTENPNLPA